MGMTRKCEQCGEREGNWENVEEFNGVGELSIAARNKLEK